MSTISAGTAPGTALVTSGDTTGQLVFQTNGTTTALTLNTNQTATFAGAISAPSISLSGGALPVSSGGTGSTSLTANNVLLGNGTSAVQVVAPGTAGNVLTSNGTTWQSTAPASGIPITLTGPLLSANLLQTNPNTLTLTAFDLYTTYTITSNNGSVSRTNETITFTPTSAGTVSITVNGRTVGPWTVLAAGAQEYTTAGIYTWVAPAGVTSVSVVCIGGGAGGSGTQGGSGGGLGWKNNISVTPGNSYTVFVGAGGSPGVGGQDSYFISTGTVVAYGGSGSGGSYIGDGGGNGGSGGPYDAGGYTGGGGAGGYAGNGGNGTAGSGNSSFGVGNGGGGAGASGSSYSGGGGVGIYGQGVSGSSSSAAGSGGTSGTTSVAGVHGGGGGYNMTGGRGAIRIVWPGTLRLFPSTNVGA